MIYDRFSRRRSNKQFNRCSLNAQDKIKLINQIREERSANSIVNSQSLITVHHCSQQNTKLKQSQDQSLKTVAKQGA